jgi:HAD superfamily hydrolase (TIGR01509 family)
MIDEEIKAIIFDMDGVLIEAKDWHYEALNKALKLFGFEISRYDHLITYDGLPTSRKLNMLTKERGLPVKLHKFINTMKQKYTMEITHVECRPMFQHEYALSNLKAKGYKLALASNSIRNTIEVMLTKSNLITYLEFYLSNQDVEMPKPSPDIYLKAIERLNLRPEQCLILEDNENGIRAARESGAHVMVVNDVKDVTFQNITSEISRIERKI